MERKSAGVDERGQDRAGSQDTQKKFGLFGFFSSGDVSPRHRRLKTSTSNTAEGGAAASNSAGAGGAQPRCSNLSLNLPLCHNIAPKTLLNASTAGWDLFSLYGQTHHQLSSTPSMEAHVPHQSHTHTFTAASLKGSS